MIMNNCEEATGIQCKCEVTQKGITESQLTSRRAIMSRGKLSIHGKKDADFPSQPETEQKPLQVCHSALHRPASS
jgi:hypothetical protein